MPLMTVYFLSSCSWTREPAHHFTSYILCSDRCSLMLSIYKWFRKSKEGRGKILRVLSRVCQRHYLCSLFFMFFMTFTSLLFISRSWSTRFPYRSTLSLFRFTIFIRLFHFFFLNNHVFYSHAFSNSMRHEHTDTASQRPSYTRSVFLGVWNA